MPSRIFARDTSSAGTKREHQGASDTRAAIRAVSSGRQQEAVVGEQYNTKGRISNVDLEAKPSRNSWRCWRCI